MKAEDHQVFSVAALGLSNQEQVLLETLVKLMPAGTGQRWSYVGTGPASVVVVDTDSPEGSRYLRSAPRTPLITLGGAPPGHPHLNRPIRNAELREILSRLAQTLQTGPEVSPPPASPPGPGRPSVLERLEGLKHRLQPAPPPPTAAPPAAAVPADHTLLETLAHATLRHPSAITVDTLPLVVLDPTTRWGFVKGGLNGLAAVCRQDAGRIGHLRFSPREVEGFKRQAEAIPLERLRWHCAIQFSAGRLLNGIADWPAFRLRRWPDFGNLPYRREFARIARHLMTHPASVAQLAVRGGIGADEVAGFLNAAHLCGWLERAAAPADDPVKPPLSRPARAGLIGKLRTSLGI